jgi:alpha-glucuronidase
MRKLSFTLENGYELWLRYRQVDNPERLTQYRQAINEVVVPGTGDTIQIISDELKRSLPVLLARQTPISKQKPGSNALVVGTVGELETMGVDVSPTQR